MCTIVFHNHQNFSRLVYLICVYKTIWDFQFDDILDRYLKSNVIHCIVNLKNKFRYTKSHINIRNTIFNIKVNGF